MVRVAQTTGKSAVSTAEDLGLDFGRLTEHAAVNAQRDSDVVQRRNRTDLESMGVIFCGINTAVRDFPQLIDQYAGHVISPSSNSSSAHISSSWSAGSFVYVPQGLDLSHVSLQPDSLVDVQDTGPFSRTLIIADKGSNVQFTDGCSAPMYSSAPERCATVEIVVKESARVTYASVQNWSSNVCSLGTMRAVVEAEGQVKWIDGTIGGRRTVNHPRVVLSGPKSSGEVCSIIGAGAGQYRDVGASIVHAAAETSSKILAKSISGNGGRTSYRAHVRVDADAPGCTSHVQCDALILDDASFSDAYPVTEATSPDARIDRQTSEARIGDQQLFYLMSRGLTEAQATGMVVNGFIEPITRTLPFAQAVEWSRLIELQMEGSVG